MFLVVLGCAASSIVSSEVLNICLMKILSLPPDIWYTLYITYKPRAKSHPYPSIREALQM